MNTWNFVCSFLLCIYFIPKVCWEVAKFISFTSLMLLKYNLINDLKNILSILYYKNSAVTIVHTKILDLKIYFGTESNPWQKVYDWQATQMQGLLCSCSWAAVITEEGANEQKAHHQVRLLLFGLSSIKTIYYNS